MVLHFVIEHFFVFTLRLIDIFFLHSVLILNREMFLLVIFCVYLMSLGLKVIFAGVQVYCCRKKKRKTVFYFYLRMCQFWVKTFEIVRVVVKCLFFI